MQRTPQTNHANKSFEGMDSQNREKTQTISRQGRNRQKRSSKELRHTIKPRHTNSNYTQSQIRWQSWPKTQEGMQAKKKK